MIHRNVLLLSASQALATSGASLVVFVGGILGSRLAPTPTLATLPVALMVVGVALFTVPASLIMHRIGRKHGFMAAAGLAMVSSLAAALAVFNASFTLLCAATALIGSNLAFVQQYRFAAAESVPAERTGRAVSIVLIGGIAAGFLGPELGRLARNWLPAAEYSGSFAALAALYLGVLGLLVFYKPADQKLVETTHLGSERPLLQIISQPVFLVAMLSGAVAYGMMSLIMTATPVNMHVIEGHTLEATGRVIQSHIIAMYVPSLFIGALMDRLGVTRVMGLGLGAMGLVVAATLHPVGVLSYWVGLVLLGIGWNFLFVGGTVLLTHSYRPAERFKTQAFNDLSIFSVQAVASLSAGTLVYQVGWTVLVAITLPVLAGLFLALFWMRGRLEQQHHSAV